MPFYISLWPKNIPSNGFKKFIEKREHHFMRSYDSDEEAEERPPETIICLYSLKPSNIINKFEAIKSKLQGWTLFGSNKIINKGSAESCASLAYKLLKAGGIYELCSSGYSSEFSLTATPDDLAALVKKAKTKELKRYPKTQQFTFLGETPVRNKRNCFTM